MKKVAILAAAMLFAVAASAQNKAIDALAEKYTDTEGFTIVNLDGDTIKGMSGMIPQDAGGEGTIEIDGIKVAVNDILKEIAAISVILYQEDNGGSFAEAFASEVRNTIAKVKYSPLASFNQDGMNVNLLSADIKRGKLKNNKEVVMSMVQDGQVILVRIIGNLDPDLLVKLASQMNNRS